MTVGIDEFVVAKIRRRIIFLFEMIDISLQNPHWIHNLSSLKIILKELVFFKVTGSFLEKSLEFVAFSQLFVTELSLLLYFILNFIFFFSIFLLFLNMNKFIGFEFCFLELFCTYFKMYEVVQFERFYGMKIFTNSLQSRIKKC